MPVPDTSIRSSIGVGVPSVTETEMHQVQQQVPDDD